jgi:hypothetical protein
MHALLWHPRVRLRYRLALAAAGLAAGNGAALARSPVATRRLLALQCGLAAGLVAQRVATQPLAFPVWVHAAPWPAYPIQAQGLFGLDATQPGPGRRIVHDIPQVHYGAAGWQTNPALVAWWALARLNRALLDPADTAAWDSFWRPIAWLRAHARPGKDGAVLWPYTFPWREGRAVLRPPWVSALAQGLAISALVRAWDIGHRAGDLDLARRAAASFAIAAERGGVRAEEDGDVFFEEYPAQPYARILDGFAFAILGLHDLATHGGDDDAAAHFRAGLATLVRRIDTWDFARCWSWYGRHGLLATAQYNSLNACLVQVLGTLSGERALSAAGQRWWPARLTAAQRALVRTVGPLLWARFVVRQTLSRG